MVNTTDTTNTTRCEQECLFDMDELGRAAVAATPWSGVPLTYSAEYATPDALDAGMERYRAEFGHFGCLPRSHMWRRDYYYPTLIAEAVGHELHFFKADGRCDISDHDHSSAPLPGRLISQANCPQCRWHHIGEEREVVEAWHDHAMPGWRDLPVLPIDTKSDLKWARETYPAQWQFEGAPIQTVRVFSKCPRAGQSPFGGYDLAAPTPEGVA